MKKLIVRFIAFLLIVGGLTTSFLIAKPQQEVKADEPSLYYFYVDTSHESYMTIILYVLDVANLEIDECSFNRLLSGKTPSYSAYEAVDGGFGTAQFVRNTNLDYGDYHAYNYSYNYPVDNYWLTCLFWLHCGNVLKLDNNEFITYDLYIPYYPLFKEYYDDGYDDGYQDGSNDRNAYWEDYIQDYYESVEGAGYQRIFGLGEDAGYTAGYREGQESYDTMGWFEIITSGVSNIMSISLLPAITIGSLIFIPIMFMILSGVLWIWRRK